MAWNKFALVLAVVASLLLLAALASLVPSNKWFVRMLDLLREPMILIAALLMVLALVAGTQWRWMTGALLALVIAINVGRIWPYSAFAPKEVTLAEHPLHSRDPRCFSAMAVNVKVENKNHARMIAQLRRHDPDLLFLMETDGSWVDALEPFLARYSHVRRHPRSDAFGLVFATRLPVRTSAIAENTYRDTPTLYATVEPRGAVPIEFIGLHPKPPLPDWNTAMRDQNIIEAGTKAPAQLPDALVMGDFNDVPWSSTVTKFRNKGNWRDPRIGRGTYATFPADMVMVGWPLDQLMVKGEAELISFAVLPPNGSDHRAVIAHLCAPAQPS